MIALIISLFTSIEAYSFPEMIRHGYTQCAACHFSPSGGGLLNLYGRTISREILSTWGYEGEEFFANKLFGEPEKFHPGGDLRFAQIFTENKELRQAAFFPMQADFEAAYEFSETLNAVVAVGIEGGKNDRTKRGKVSSRRHYVNYRPWDSVNLRAGKFYQNFGLNLANHTAYTRKDLGFDQGLETDNFEVAFETEKQSTFATYSAGRTDATIDEKSGSLVHLENIFETWRVGVQALYAYTPNQSRTVTGLTSLAAFTEKLFMQSEFDLQTRQNNKRGYVTYQRLGYEVHKGVIPAGIYQYSHLDLEDPKLLKRAYGLGIQFFPRPHLDISAEYFKGKDGSQAGEDFDSAYLILHYYL